MRRVEKYIPTIIEILSNDYKNAKIPKIYNSYIAAFGSSVAMNGLVATVALYEDMNKIKQKRTKGDRSYITSTILKVLSQEDTNIQQTSLLKYVLENDETKLKRKIIDIAIAFKLALRTFELEESEEQT